MDWRIFRARNNLIFKGSNLNPINIIKDANNMIIYHNPLALKRRIRTVISTMGLGLHWMMMRSKYVSDPAFSNSKGKTDFNFIMVPNSSIVVRTPPKVQGASHPRKAIANVVLFTLNKARDGSHLDQDDVECP